MKTEKKNRLQKSAEKTLKGLLKKALMGVLLQFCIAMPQSLALEDIFSFSVDPYLGWSLLGALSGPIPLDRQATTTRGGGFNGFQLGVSALVFVDSTWFAGPDIGFIPALNFAYYDSAQGKYTGLTDLSEATSIKFGVIAGVQIPDTGLRLWAGYNFEDDLVFLMDHSDGTSTQIGIQGAGVKVGASYLLWEHVAFNVEYVYIYYSELDTTTTSSASWVDQESGVRSVSSNLLNLFVSFPFDIGMRPSDL